MFVPMAILTRIDNWEIDVNAPFDENMNNAKVLVNEAVENNRCMSLIFYRIIDTGAVTGSTITTNNTSATNSIHVSDAMREQRNRDWESIRLLKESKERDTKDRDEEVTDDPPLRRA